MNAQQLDIPFLLDAEEPTSPLALLVLSFKSHSVVLASQQVTRFLV